MKSLSFCLLLTFLFSSYNSISQTNLILNTQNQVDSFNILCPQCISFDYAYEGYVAFRFC